MSRSKKTMCDRKPNHIEILPVRSPQTGCPEYVQCRSHDAEAWCLNTVYSDGHRIFAGLRTTSEIKPVVDQLFRAYPEFQGRVVIAPRETGQDRCLLLGEAIKELDRINTTGSASPPLAALADILRPATGPTPVDG